MKISIFCEACFSMIHQVISLMGNTQDRYIGCWPSRHLIYYLDTRKQALEFLLIARRRRSLDEVKVFYNNIDATPILKNSLGIPTPGVDLNDLKKIKSRLRLNPPSPITWFCDSPCSRELEKISKELERVKWLRKK